MCNSQNAEARIGEWWRPSTGKTGRGQQPHLLKQAHGKDVEQKGLMPLSVRAHICYSASKADLWKACIQDTKLCHPLSQIDRFACLRPSRPAVQWRLWRLHQETHAALEPRASSQCLRAVQLQALIQLPC